MSAFCGILDFEGAPVCGEELDAMSVALARSGPDAFGRWLGLGAGLAHRMLFTTPESLTESLPLEDAETGLIFTGDARVDNREELLAAMGLSGTATAGLSDSAIILKGFACWGEGLFDRLLGDFAVALWNPARRELLLVRDHFGVKPLYYTVRGRQLLFASEIKGVLAYAGMPQELNYARLRSAIEVTDPDIEATFYRGILRVPPATVLVIRDGQIHKRTYWKPDAERELPERKPEEFAEEFRAIFSQAVSCRLRSAFPVGSHLSGGLDSTAVTCVARELLRQRAGPSPLYTFSLIFESVKGCDEREYIEPVVAGGGVESHYIAADSVGPTFGLEEHFEFEEEDTFYPNNYLIEQLSARVAQTGVRVCLDGFDGDTIVSHGWDRFAELACAGSWRKFGEEARAAARFNPRLTSDGIFRSFGSPQLSALANRGAWGKTLSGFGQVAREVGMRPAIHALRQVLRQRCPKRLKELVGWWHRKPTRSGLSRKLQFFTPEFLERLDLEKPETKKEESFTAVRARQCAALTNGLLSFALEHTGRVYARHGFEARHPFFDKRVVEFCLSLPSSQKLMKGVPRGILRNAIGPLMPAKVRERVSKNNFTPVFVQGLLRRDRERVNGLLARLQTSSTDGPVNWPVAKEWYARLGQAERYNEEEVVAFLVALSTGYWFARHRFSPGSKIAAATTRR